MPSSPAQRARRMRDLADLDVEIDSLLVTWDDDGSAGCPTSEIRYNWLAFAHAIEACMHSNSSTTGRRSLFVKFLIACPWIPASRHSAAIDVSEIRGQASSEPPAPSALLPP